MVFLECRSEMFTWGGFRSMITFLRTEVTTAPACEVTQRLLKTEFPFHPSHFRAAKI